MKALIAATTLAGAAMLATPASAQGTPDDVVEDDVRMSIVYGEDAAPECPEDAICVVARLPENERYRIPPELRFSDDPANMAWTRRVERLEVVGNFGTLSCSPAGVGGFTGCTQEMVRQAYGDRAEGANVRFSELIAAARADRLSRIDEDAAAEQERVEELERQYMERLEAEREAELPEEASSSPVVVETQDGVAPSDDGEPIMGAPDE